TNALMVFHQPFLNAVAESFPGADTLIGKPMPVSAAENFYRKLKPSAFNPATQVQWLIDTQERLLQYQALAKRLGVQMRLSIEIDVGLHRGGLPEPEALDAALATINADPTHLSLAGFMGYEPHLTGMQAGLDHPAVQSVLGIYQGFMDRAGQGGIDVGGLTLNGAGSHTLRIYEKDKTMNDLAAGSGVVKPTDFDTYHLNDNRPAMFIATPILKRYDELKMPGDPWLADFLPWWDPNMRRLYFIYGGYWKANVVSPQGVPDSLYHSTNQQPITTSESVDLQVDDYIFLRPTQSEHVMLQFGDLLAVKDGEPTERWPVFHQTG
ncbi:MAG: alanine racemase, partial [Gammaproteobacteria bacterium]|nr:alanine racemase [Gammaproteobacteria bacterium]